MYVPELLLWCGSGSLGYSHVNSTIRAACVAFRQPFGDALLVKQVFTRQHLQRQTMSQCSVAPFAEAPSHFRLAQSRTCTHCNLNLLGTGWPAAQDHPMLRQNNLCVAALKCERLLRSVYWNPAPLTVVRVVIPLFKSLDTWVCVRKGDA